jgi:hypothetical protein
MPGRELVVQNVVNSADTKMQAEGKLDKANGSARNAVGDVKDLRETRPTLFEAVPYASTSHFFMKLDFAAPDNFLPSLLTAFVSQLSILHFFKKLAFAAPASGLPSFPIALSATPHYGIATT